jgi:predicted transcriptional regulator
MTWHGWRGVNLREDLYEKVQKKAKEEERSVAWVVGKAVEKYLKEEADK